MLDLGPKTRVVFAAVYVVVQAVLVVTAGRRPDHAFGFQMFSEASTIEIHLSRKVRTPSRSEEGAPLVPVVGGAWAARDARGELHRFAWRDRIKDPILSNLDVLVFASYGASAQLARLDAALEDVARHIPEDAETQALVADVTVRRNGGEPAHTRIVKTVR